MTHVKIVLDGKIEFDGSVTEWERKPPEMFKDLIRPQAKAPGPHLKAIMISMADAVREKRSTIIECTTGSDDLNRDTWTLKVTYK